MNTRITLKILELCLVVIILMHGAGAGFAAVAIGLFLIAGLITRLADRLFPEMKTDGELILVFGLAAMAFGWALWKSGPGLIDLLVGWFLISALSLVGFWMARWLIGKLR